MKASLGSLSPLLWTICWIVVPGAGCGSAVIGGGDQQGAPSVGLTVGKPCVVEGVHYACAAGLTCVTQSAGSYAICDVPVQAPAGTCCQQNVDCAIGMICDAGLCVANRSGRCSPAEPFGAAQCWQDYTCEPDNSAAGGHCVGAAQPKGLGEVCGAQNECGPDAFCNGHCTELGDEGAPCIAEPTGVGCKPGYACSVENVCHWQCGPK
jgi:hypothetical protein